MQAVQACMRLTSMHPQGLFSACVAGDDEEDVALEEAAAQARKERAIAASAYGHGASGAAGDTMTRSRCAAGLRCSAMRMQPAAVVIVT